MTVVYMSYIWNVWGIWWVIVKNVRFSRKSHLFCELRFDFFLEFFSKVVIFDFVQQKIHQDTVDISIPFMQDSQLGKVKKYSIRFFQLYVASDRHKTNWSFFGHKNMRFERPTYYMIMVYIKENA